MIWAQGRRHDVGGSEQRCRFDGVRALRCCSAARAARRGAARACSARCRSARCRPADGAGARGRPRRTRASGAKEWSGESGSSGHPQMQASAIRAAAANFESCVAGLVAARRQAQHLARELRQVHRGADARSPHHGLGGRAAGVHQGVLGLSRHPGQRRAHRRRPRDPRQVQGDLRQGREAVRRRPQHHHRDLGRRVRTTARSAATARCCARPRRSPASAAARPISATSFCPRWKSCIAAISSPSNWSAPGPARSGRPSSCRHRSRNTRSISTATAAATSSAIAADLIASTANNLKKDGWVPSETWGYEVVVPKGFNYLLADRTQAAHHRRVGDARHQARRRQAVPASAREGLSAGAGRQSGPGLPDAAQLPASS